MLEYVITLSMQLSPYFSAGMNGGYHNTYRKKPYPVNKNKYKYIKP